MSATDILDAYIAEQSGGPEGYPLRLHYPGQSVPVTHKSYSFSTHSSQAKSQTKLQERKALHKKSQDAARIPLSKGPKGAKPLGPARATAKSAAAALVSRSKAAARNPGRSIQSHTTCAPVEPETVIAKPCTSAPESVSTRLPHVVKSTALTKLRVASMNRQPSLSVQQSSVPRGKAAPTANVWEQLVQEQQSVAVEAATAISRKHVHQAKEEISALDDRATEPLGLRSCGAASLASSCASTASTLRDQEPRSLAASRLSDGSMSHQGSVASGSQPLVDICGDSGARQRGCRPRHQPARMSFEAQHPAGKQTPRLSAEQWNGGERASPRAVPAESSWGSQRGSEGFTAECTAANQTSSVEGGQYRGAEASEESGRVSAVAGASTQTALDVQASSSSGGVHLAVGRLSVSDAFSNAGRQKLVAVGRVEVQLDFSEGLPLPKLKRRSSSLELPQATQNGPKCSWKAQPSVQLRQAQREPSLPAALSFHTGGQPTCEDSDEILRDSDAGSCKPRDSETCAASCQAAEMRRRASTGSSTDEQHWASDGQSQRVPSWGGCEQIGDPSMHVDQERAQGACSELLPSNEHKGNAADNAEKVSEAVDRRSSGDEEAASSTHLYAEERTGVRLPHPAQQQLFDAPRCETSGHGRKDNVPEASMKRLAAPQCSSTTGSERPALPASEILRKLQALQGRWKAFCLQPSPPRQRQGQAACQEDWPGLLPGHGGNRDSAVVALRLSSNGADTTPEAGRSAWQSNVSLLWPLTNDDILSCNTAMAVRVPEGGGSEGRADSARIPQQPGNCVVTEFAGSPRASHPSTASESGSTDPEDEESQSRDTTCDWTGEANHWQRGDSLAFRHGSGRRTHLTPALTLPASGLPTTGSLELEEHIWQQYLARGRTRAAAQGSTEGGELAFGGSASGARVPSEHASAAQDAHRDDAVQSSILLPCVEKPESKAA